MLYSSLSPKGRGCQDVLASICCNTDPLQQQQAIQLSHCQNCTLPPPPSVVCKFLSGTPKQTRQKPVSWTALNKNWMHALLFSILREKLRAKGFHVLVLHWTGGKYYGNWVCANPDLLHSQRVPPGALSCQYLAWGRTETSPSGQTLGKSAYWVYVSVFSLPPQGELRSWEFSLDHVILGQGEVLWQVSTTNLPTYSLRTS